MTLSATTAPTGAATPLTSAALVRRLHVDLHRTAGQACQHRS